MVVYRIGIFFHGPGREYVILIGVGRIGQGLYTILSRTIISCNTRGGVIAFQAGCIGHLVAIPVPDTASDGIKKQIALCIAYRSTALIGRYGRVGGIYRRGSIKI
ncbi:hypothetical protein D3C87_1771510 [compost metagenome]